MEARRKEVIVVFLCDDCVSKDVGRGSVGIWYSIKWDIAKTDANAVLADVPSWGKVESGRCKKNTRLSMRRGEWIGSPTRQPLTQAACRIWIRRFLTQCVIQGRDERWGVVLRSEKKRTCYCGVAELRLGKVSSTSDESTDMADRVWRVVSADRVCWFVVSQCGIVTINSLLGSFGWCIVVDRQSIDAASVLRCNPSTFGCDVRLRKM